MNQALPAPLIIDVDPDEPIEPPPPSQDLAVLMDQLAQEIAKKALGDVSLEDKISAFKSLTTFYIGNKKIKGGGDTKNSPFDAFKHELNGSEPETDE